MEQDHLTKTKETARLEAFSDGVFAIAITLLVLELITKLNPASDERLMETVGHHWRSFVAFAIGFVTLLICWINHHISLDFIRKIDTGFMWVNGFLLFVVTLTPFSTAILAQYLEKEGHIAVAFFAFNFVLISIAAYWICAYAYRHHLILSENRTTFHAYIRVYQYGLLYNIIAFFFCFVSILIPLILYVFLFIAFAAPNKLARRLQSRKKINKDFTS